MADWRLDFLTATGSTAGSATATGSVAVSTGPLVELRVDLLT